MKNQEVKHGKEEPVEEENSDSDYEWVTDEEEISSGSDEEGKIDIYFKGSGQYKDMKDKGLLKKKKRVRRKDRPLKVEAKEQVKVEEPIEVAKGEEDDLDLLGREERFRSTIGEVLKTAKAKNKLKSGQDSYIDADKFEKFKEDEIAK